MASPVNGEVSQNHDGSRRISRHVDYHTIGAAAENRAEARAGSAVNREGFSNGDGTEATWIQNVNLSAFCGLGNRSRKGLARRGAAAWVNVVADAGYPGARCLSLGHGRKSEREDRDCECVDCEPKLVHSESPFFS